MSNPAPSSRHDVEDRLTSRAMNDPAFRQRLLDDPQAAVSEELGVTLPSELRVTVLQETPDTLYLVLPADLGNPPSRELSDTELSAVAGGGAWADMDMFASFASKCC